MNLKFIYKIINIDELKKAKSSGTYSGSSKDIQDGYIHFSSDEQIAVSYTHLTLPTKA